jgi:FKBP-type peptidyl-prolyl cis-trans isomerase
MVVGEKRRVWVPPALGYPDYGTVVFDLSLQSITPGPVAPEYVAHRPADVVLAKDGFATKQMKAGKGREHPNANDLVRVFFAIWEPSGKLLESSGERLYFYPVFTSIP